MGLVMGKVISIGPNLKVVPLDQSVPALDSPKPWSVQPSRGVVHDVNGFGSDARELCLSPSEARHKAQELLDAADIAEWLDRQS